MFERLSARATQRARDRAEARVLAITARLAEELPPGVVAEAVGDGVLVSGRGLLRWSVENATLRGLLQGGWR